MCSLVRISSLHLSWYLVFSQASEDARKMMGDRKFYDQMLTDACLYAKQKITRDVDVTSLKDYMQVSKCCK